MSSWHQEWEARRRRWALEAKVDEAILAMNEISMNPDATHEQWEKAKALVDDAERALRGSPHTLAGVDMKRTPGRIL